jgi:hypothetical protein
MITQSARITGPVRYQTDDGRSHDIPLGPCLVEQLDDRSIDIIWGASGQRSVALPVEVVASARAQGNLLML